MEEKQTCCTQNSSNKKVLSGIFFGIIPHSLCILFVFFSITGAVFATSILKRFLLVPYFLQLLVLISLLLATLSSVVYLKKMNCLSATGIKNNWKYISVLYSTTILVNLLMFLIVMPVLASANSGNIMVQNSANISINVEIPCSGHALLIIDELKKDQGVYSVRFKMPNTFEIEYEPKMTSPEKILSQEIFKTYKATME